MRRHSARSTGRWRPALPPQVKLWLLHELDSRRADNFVPLALRYEGILPVHVLQHALGEVVRRHAVLRWQFRTTREGLEFIEHPWTMPVIPCAEIDGTRASGARVTSLVHEVIARPFDIGAYPLFRFLHVRLGAREGLIVGVFHHTLADGWSMAVLGAELEALWGRMRSGLSPELPDLDLQYEDLWEPDRVLPGRSSPERGLTYWKDALRDLDGAAAWPWPRRKTRGASHRVRRWSEHLDEREAAALRRQAGRLRASPFLFFAAILSVLRWKLSGRTVAVIGTDAAGRTEPGAERLIGFFINVLPLRVETDPGARFVDHLEKIRRQFLIAYEHQGVSYEDIVRSIAPPRTAGRNPLFNIKLMMHNFLDHQLRLPGLTIASVPIELHDSSEDIKLFIRPVAGSYALHWEARADCLSDAEIAGLSDQFRQLTSQVLASPTIPLRTLTLRAPDLSDTVGVRDASVPARLSEQRGAAGRDASDVSEQARDDRVLILAPGTTWTVRAFTERVDALAASLRAQGVGPGVVVGLYLPPSIDFLLGACATLAAGGGFVCVDPRETPEVADRSLRAARPAVVVIADVVLERPLGPGVQVVRIHDLPVPAEGNGAGRVRPARADDLALVHVEVTDGHEVEAYGFTQASLAAQIEAWSATWRAEPGQYVANPDPEDALSLLADLRLCLDQQRTLLLGDVKPGDLTDPARPQAACCYVRAHASSLSTPLPAGLNAGASGRSVVIEGRVTPAMCALFRRAHPGVRLHLFPRLPGVAIAASHVEWHEAWDELCRLPSGTPLNGMTVHLLDGWMQPLPVTGVGEIYVGGAIATAVHGDVERTACRLVPSPFGAGRLLKTGVSGARLADGTIMMLGTRRLLRGAPGRVCDAARVEAVLLEHPDVADALVLNAGDPDGPRIAALVTAAREGLREAELWTVLSGRLTRAALPDAVRMVAALPLDRRGRIVSWRRDLLAQARPSRPTAHTPLQAALASIWRDLLGLDREVGADEDFFDLGGDSLVATRLAFRIEEQFEMAFAVADVFAHRTLARLAERVASAADATVPAVKLERVDPKGLLPVASAQNRLLFLHSLNPRDCAYNSPAAIELRGRPSVPLVIQCFQEVARRQEVLRTVFLTVAGELRQAVLQNATVSPTCVDLTALPDTCRAAWSKTLRRAELRRPFLLHEAPAFRAAIADLGAGVCEVSLTVHHLISDAWSQRIVVRELSGLAARYVAGLPSALPPLAFQYRDYAAWQARRLQGSHLARLVDAWTGLAGSADFEPIRLSARAPANGPRRVGYRRFAISPLLQRKLEAAARTRGATLYMLVLAAFQCLLHRASGRATATLLASAANRYPREMADVVGFFAHNFPIVSRWETGDTVFTLLERTRDYSVAALRLQELPFDRVVEAIRRKRPDVDPSRLNVSFVMTPSADGGVSIPGVEVRPLVVDDVAPRFDLEMQLNAGTDGIAGTLEYSTAFLNGDTAEALVAQYLTILDGVANPEGARRSSRPTAGLRRAVPVAARSRAVPALRS
ncbi:MAG: condensation domain-containing protein [Vicinamibacterales bacterium]